MPTDLSPTMQANDLLIGYNGRSILPPIQLTVQPGELWVLAGANGSGKSTLMKTLVGLLAPVGGTFNRPGPKDIAYLPQRLPLDPMAPVRVIDLVRQGVERDWSFLRPWLSATDQQRIRKAMLDADCTDLARRSFHTLSEGQKQRVLLARALCSEPKLLLMDEPTSAMDLRAQHEALDRLNRLRRERPLAIVLISHHLDHALTIADHVLFVDNETQSVAAGPTVDVIHHPDFRLRFPGLAERLPLGDTPA